MGQRETIGRGTLDYYDKKNLQFIVDIRNEYLRYFC